MGRLSFVTFVLFSLALTSCNYQRMKMSPFAGGPPPVVPGEEGRLRSTFKEIQADILMNSYCIGCHGPGGAQSSLETYDDVMSFIEPGKPDESDLYVRMREGDMPRGRGPKVTGKMLEAVKVWIENGANNN
jgi:mono/diheme cytochrome c family protein